MSNIVEWNGWGGGAVRLFCWFCFDDSFLNIVAWIDLLNTLQPTDGNHCYWRWGWGWQNSLESATWKTGLKTAKTGRLRYLDDWDPVHALQLDLIVHLDSFPPVIITRVHLRHLSLPQSRPRHLLHGDQLGAGAALGDVVGVLVAEEAGVVVVVRDVIKIKFLLADIAVRAPPGHQSDFISPAPDVLGLGLGRGDEHDGLSHDGGVRYLGLLQQALLLLQQPDALRIIKLELGLHVLGETKLGQHDDLPAPRSTAPQRSHVVQVHGAVGLARRVGDGVGDVASQLRSSVQVEHLDFQFDFLQIDGIFPFV